MMRTYWRNLLLAATTATGLANGAAWAAPPTVVLREPGRPDRTCVIERSTPQADGTVLHEVRDTATGERLRVADDRRQLDAPAVPPLVIPAEPAVPAVPAAKSQPPTPAASPTPTLAQLASYQTPTVVPTPPIRPAAVAADPAPALPPAVQRQLGVLRSATDPAERERAATVLALGDWHAASDVVAALTRTARTDPAASVRVCLVRCLYRVSADAPQVIPVLAQLQDDADDEVQRTARFALEQLAKK